MSDQGSWPPPPDPDRPVDPPAGPPAGYGAPPTYGQAPGFGYGQGPPPGYGHPAGPPPNNYLVWAILTTVGCCTPLGIASIVFSAQVNNKWAAGDIAGARASAEKAKKFAIWSAISTGVVILIFIAVAIVAAVAGSDSTTY